MRKKLFFGLILLVGITLYFYKISNAAPQPRGCVYEITARISSVRQEPQKRYFDVQKNAYIISMSIDIEIDKIGRMVKEGQRPKVTEYLDKYSVGQKLNVNAKVKEDDLNAGILAAGSLVKGNVYSHGDETGDWYNFDVVENVDK